MPRQAEESGEFFPPAQARLPAAPKVSGRAAHPSSPAATRCLLWSRTRCSTSCSQVVPLATATAKPDATSSAPDRSASRDYRFPLSLRAEARASHAHAKKQNAKAKSVILVFLGGGISHHDSFDPKPDAPADIRGKYRPIHTNVPGLTIGEKLPLMAKVMDRVALVRSGSHNNDHHETATNWVLSGRFGTPFGDYPAVGAVVAHETGFGGSRAALRRRAAESVVHVGTRQIRVPRRPVRVVQGRRPEPGAN